MTFQDLNLLQPIAKAIQEEGYTQPTPIQAKAIPTILKQQDVLGCAQTGTGKTAAFAIPILQTLHLANAPKPTLRALILSPTRELVLQIEENIKAYGRHLKLKHLSIFGGVPQGAQVRALQHGVDILVATPGRLMDLMQQGYIHLDQIKILVLDEADRMLDMGFVHDVKKIVSQLPTQRQTLFFSATMPTAILKLANSMLKNPVSITVNPVSSTVEKITQSVYFVERKDKNDLLVQLLNHYDVTRSLVFTRTKHGADKLVKHLGKKGIYAAAIHGNKSQNARQKALSDFKNSSIRVLVATDIAARGIDIDDLAHVVNYEIPNIPETYVHRIGRTGRAGQAGTAVSFCDQDERSDLNDIQKLTGVQVTVAASHALYNQKNK